MIKKYSYVSVSPFSYLTPSVTNMSVTILAVLSPQVLMLFLTKSFSSLIVIVLCIVSSVCAELLCNILRRKFTLFDLTAVVQGLCIGFFTPSTYPLIPLCILVFLSLIIIKYVFGGSSHSWANPIAYSVIILYFLGTSFFPSMPFDKDMIETGSSIQVLLQNNQLPLFTFDQKLSAWLNTYIFSHIGAEIPQGYLSLMWDTRSVIPAFRFGFLTLFGSLFLFSFRMLRHSIPFSFVITYGLLIRLFLLTPINGSIGQGDILLALFSGGSLFIAFFLLDWYGTTPLSKIGKIFYGIVSGIVAFLILGCGSTSIGAMFTVLSVNIISPCIQIIEEKIYEYFVVKNAGNKTGAQDAAAR